MQLDFESLKNQNLTLKVIDMLGNEMHQETLNSNLVLNSIQINVSNYANGAYIIQLYSNNKTLLYGKIVKQ